MDSCELLVAGLKSDLHEIRTMFYGLKSAYVELQVLNTGLARKNKDLVGINHTLRCQESGLKRKITDLENEIKALKDNA